MAAETQIVVARPVLPPLLLAMRPYQWPKNLIVFAAFIFSTGEAWHISEPSTWWPLFWRSCLLFVLWCMVSSATYLWNDVRDREADRVHPRKARRPIASGDVRASTAVATAVGLAAVALPLTFALSLIAGIATTGYVLLMTGYSSGLKRVAVLDVMILCSGVVARAVAGAGAIDVVISPWLYICSSLGAFFFASTKRWAEFRQLGAEAARHRPSLAHYDVELLGQMVLIGAAGTLISYAIYSVESAHVPANGTMILTLPFVAFGIFRFLALIRGPRGEDAPDRILFTDRPILASIAGFVAVALAVLALR